MNEEAPDFEALLRGVSFRPIEAKMIVKDLAEGDALMLEREPTNQYDENAIKVIHPDSTEFIGFVQKEIAVNLAPWMDRGFYFTCHVGDRMSASTVILIIKPIKAINTDESASEKTLANARAH